jgi:hypothetical protein
MIINKMSENINKLFKSFIKDITEVFPEYKSRVEKYYGEVYESEDPKHPKIKEFLENIDEISEKIIDKDISIFEEDPIILQNISFKLLWNTEGVSDQTKNSIWKYLQTFCIININLESTSEMISEVVKKIEANEKVTDKQTFKNMKKLKKLNENFDIKEIEKVVNENPNSVDPGMNGMDKMFENTSIGQIAKEITQDLDIENMVNNGGGIEDLFSGGNMMNIMNTISSKMAEKQGSMDPESLMKEATTICSTMGDNPLFSSLLGMQGDMMKNMMGGLSETQETQDSSKEDNIRNIEFNNPSHDPNKKRAQLQQKLKDKQKKLNVEKIE